MSTLLLNVENFNPCSGGIRALHYLASLLHAADVSVAVTHRCFYAPALPIRTSALAGDIVIYPDQTIGNPFHARRICRLMAYYASGYYHGNRIGKDECCLIYPAYNGDEGYIREIAAHCDHPISDEDVFQFPSFNPTLCFPEPKTVANLLFGGKFAQAELAKFRAQHSMFLASGVKWPMAYFEPGEEVTLPFPHIKYPHYSGLGDLHFAYNHMIALLRRVENVYLLDHRTLVAHEAAYCGCRVFNVIGPNEFEEQHGLKEEIEPFILKPSRDLELAEKVAKRVFSFFGESVARVPSSVHLLPVPEKKLAESPAVPARDDLIKRPASPKIQRILAQAYLAEQDWAEAAPLFDALVTQFPDDLALWQGRLECARRRNHRTLAKLIFNDAVRLHPEWSAVLNVEDGSPTS
jgi:hypothetical protein